MIQYIEIEKLRLHPNNPREDVGDVTELADSIRTNGILQNLTVVPNEDDTYTVVIGHRRLAAAKHIGLPTVPCIVSSMDKVSQASTMLLENMQRSDLTPYEEAQGFQTCLNLGLSEDDLKKKTGFSKKTIKHRLKLLELDKCLFKKGVERGATIQDYIDLEQIEDMKKKNELLSKIGTNDYRYRLNDELNRQKEKRDREVFILKLSEHMEEVDSQPKGFEYFGYFCNSTMYKDFKIPEDIAERKYVFKVHYENAIEIYKETLEIDKKKKSEQEEESFPTKEQLAIEEIKKKAAAAYHTRLEFAKETYQNLSIDDCIEDSKNTELYYAFLFFSGKLKDFTWNRWNNKDSIFKEVTEKLLEDINLKKIIKDEYPSTAYKMMYKYLFAILYAKLENNDDSITVHSWEYGDRYGMYTNFNDDEIKELYTFLESHGYQPSEEEKAIMFGTHELYAKGE